MLSGEFERKLRRLNPRLHIWCGDNNHLPAGLWIMRNGEWETVCGVDKQWVGEHTQFSPEGFIIRSGWRRVLRILIQQKLIDRRHAERVFNTHLPYNPRNKHKVPVYTPKRKLIDKYAMEQGRM